MNRGINKTILTNGCYDKIYQPKCRSHYKATIIVIKEAGLKRSIVIKGQDIDNKFK
jgi:hypothetical protein